MSPIASTPSATTATPQSLYPAWPLDSHNNHVSPYLLAQLFQPETTACFERQWANSSKKLNMGKSCIRFKKADFLAFDALAGTLKKTSPRGYLASIPTRSPAPRPAAAPLPNPPGSDRSK